MLFRSKHAETKILFVDTEYSEIVQNALALMDGSQNITVVEILDDPKYAFSGELLLMFSFLRIPHFPLLWLTIL